MRAKAILMIVAAATLLAGPSLFAQQDDTPLADVAKQKASSAKAKRVITDEDMPSTSKSSPPPPSPSNSTASASTTTAASTASSDPAKSSDATSPQSSPSSSASTSSKVSDLQKQLEDVNHDEELLKKKIAQLQEKVDKAETDFRKKLYQDSIDNQQTTLSEFRKKRQELEQQISEEKSKTKE